jgi:hypothetical protein
MHAAAEAQQAYRVTLATHLATRAGQILSNLPACLHADWIRMLEADPALLAGGGHELLNTALLARFDLRWPDLSAAGHGLELAWLFAPEQLCQLFAARAVFAWRGTLGRGVDASARRQARALVGAEIFERIAGIPQARRDAPRAPFEAGHALPLGWAWLDEALAWQDPRSRRLTQLMLPPWPEHIHEAARDYPGSTTDHAGFLQALQQLFPEHSWLFGSEAASSTSA